MIKVKNGKIKVKGTVPEIIGDLADIVGDLNTIMSEGLIVSAMKLGFAKENDEKVEISKEIAQKIVKEKMIERLKEELGND